MGEYEPNDSRHVTLRQDRAPGEPPRTGPREAETRQRQPGETELDRNERGEDAEATLSEADAQAEQELREAGIEQDAEALDADDPGRPGRND